MIRLHEFITKIRNCKTQAEERAEYQKEMAAIRESFAKNEETLRPRNVTKLLFINMSGQQTNFGQMECLKLITANSLIQKRIGYLGLTQLFHQKSQLLMMATNRIRIDLNGNNNNIVSLTLCVLSQICTAELARDLHQDVLKCINNNSAYIRKKAILTSIKIVKRVPEYISQFLPKISTCLEEKSHGVLLSCMAFLENAINIDESYVGQLVDLVPKIARAYRLIAQEHNSEYQIGGVQDPFLQVAILKFLRVLRKHSSNFDKQLAEILITCHDSVCSRVTNNLKNGANAVLFECFQCFMLLEPTNQLREMVSNVLSKFISVKDANSKYLSLFNLNLMTKYDIKIVKTHKSTIFECLNQNDILIRIMALDLLYVIAAPDNTSNIIKDLLNVLLTANDEEFITQLALKICLIVEKHSQSRRWHFDTILKVLVLADQAVKEESAKSLVYLIQSTPQLQQYCMAKLFFSSSQNPQNDALSSVTLFLTGQLSDVLLKIRAANINEQNILDLIESIIFKVGVANDTISYGLSTLLKLREKFTNVQRITKMIRSFQTHSDLQVQKRACEYTKLLESTWDYDRKKEICIPIPPFKPTVETFKGIPIGQTQLDLDFRNIKMPGKSNINYDDHITNSSSQQPANEFRRPQVQKPKDDNAQRRNKVVEQTKVPQQKKQIDLFDIMNGPAETTKQPTQSNQNNQNNQNNLLMTDLNFNTNKPTTQQQNNDGMFGLLDFNIGGPSTQTQQPPQPQSSGFGGDLLGFGMQTTTHQPVQSTAQLNNQPTNSNNNLMTDLMGFGISSNPIPTQNLQNNQNNQNNQNHLLGMNLLSNNGGFNLNTQPIIQQQQPIIQQQQQPIIQQQQGGQNNGFGLNLLGSNPQTQMQSIIQPVQQNVSSGFQPIINNNPNKILAYQNNHLQIWMDCIKQSNDSTKVFTTYVNKTNNTLTEINIQAAVLKHVKLTINPLSSTTMQPFSKQVVHQTLYLVNSMVGQKGVVMKLKLGYNIAHQKFSFQEKIANFPANV